MQRSDIQARGTVNNEAQKIKLLNKKGIGPQLLFQGEDYFGYVFVKGDFLTTALEKSGKKETLGILKEVFRQMRVLDTLGLTKEEMHHPYKHILIDDKDKVTLLDFERCKHTQNTPEPRYRFLG